MALGLISNILTIIASIAFLIAVYFSFKLSKETNHEKYWLILALGFFIFAIHHWMMILSLFGEFNENIIEIIEHSSSILAALFVAYGTYGLYSSMKKVKKSLG